MRVRCKTVWIWAVSFLVTALMLGSCAGKETADVPQAAQEELISAACAGTLTDILSQLLSREEVSSVTSSEEMRGIWLSYLDLSPLMVGKEEEDFRASAAEICQNVAEFGLNTLFVQVRPFSDSFYPSEYFPWSKWASGTTGVPLAYDPVQILRDEAAKQGLEFHAWINPMRGFAEAEISQIPENFPIRQWYDDPILREQNLLFWEGNFYLNPASEAARKLIADGATEIMSRYQPDGIHIDDYFYPPHLPMEQDASSYAQYKAQGGTLSQEDWRRENTFLMGKMLGDTVHSLSETAQFGVSPRGIEQQNFDDVYLDLSKWMGEAGLLDYVAPQIYFGFNHETAPFDRVAEEWNALSASTGVPLVPGLAAYKVGQPDSYAGSGEAEWTESEGILAKQVAYLRKLPSYGGVILFRYDSLFEEERPAVMEREREALAAVFSE
ncbi:MAG: glycoside hydrolase family 10 protein [Candidatus Merdivicinus sp.]|jgi:uncharacterized lipoprotein YddW (UPF0748 family)